MAKLPYEIIEAMVQCFGRSFYYKDPVSSFMLSAGVNRSLVDKYRNEAKFVWARKVITELGESEEGQLIQRRLLTELCKLRDLPDSGVLDRDAGIDALRHLKKIAIQHDLIVKEDKQQEIHKDQLANAKAKLIQERSQKLNSLYRKFSEAITMSDRQQAGYSLEDLLKELFALFEIEYKKSYRTETQQIDGHFNFEAFDYLVEAKWRKDQPTEQEIGGFKQKVDMKLESTRGLFVAIQGVRSEVVRQFEGRSSNIIFMDGADLTCILEGRIDLRDALKFKIEKAAQEGIVFIPLHNKFHN